MFPPDIFIRGGEMMETLIMAMFDAIKHDDVLPYQWTLVLICTMYKNKGKRKQLVNHRGIFLKQIISKMFEKINMNRIGANIEKIDKFQAGARPNRSTADQTFLLRAAIDHSVYLNRPLYITLYDFSQCFDSLWLSDCLLSLWNLGVQSQTLRNIKNLNEICNIVVKTPVGMADEVTVTSIVQQGSVSGGLLCTASTAEVTQENLGGGCQIGEANMKALTFVDDIATPITELQDLYTSNDSVVWFSKKKRLSLNVPKCMLLPVNIRPTDVLPRLKIDEVVLKCVEKAEYLGDTFNRSGTNKDLVRGQSEKRAELYHQCTILVRRGHNGSVRHSDTYIDACSCKSCYTTAKPGQN